MKVRANQRPAASGTGAGLLGTLLVHAGAAFFLLAAVKPPAPSPPVYAVNLVAAPAPAPRQRLAPEATPSPPPPEPAAPVKTASVPIKKPLPSPPQKQAVEPRPRQEPTPKTSAPEAPAPGETPSTGRDATTVKTPGLDFPYPEYLRNVENQIYRRWSRPTGNVGLRAEISFMIARDGSVRTIQFVTRSGNFSYDLEAQGAIESAANSRAFGPLPDGWQADVLPISFYFEPRSQ